MSWKSLFHLRVSLSHMAATPILKPPPNPFFPFSAYLPILFISLLLLTFGPFQPEPMNPFLVFFTIIPLASRGPESNLSNTKFSVPGGGGEEAILYHLLLFFHIS